jgi:hypothetical protein
MLEWGLSCPPRDLRQSEFSQVCGEVLGFGGDRLVAGQQELTAAARACSVLPFRFTRNMQKVLGPYCIEGCVRDAMEKFALMICCSNGDVTSNSSGSISSGTISETLNFVFDNDENDLLVSSFFNKMKIVCGGSNHDDDNNGGEEKMITVDEKNDNVKMRSVDELLQAATKRENLAQMDAKFAAWF